MKRIYEHSYEFINMDSITCEIVTRMLLSNTRSLKSINVNINIEKLILKSNIIVQKNLFVKKYISRL
jgi:hypothetical protein